MSVEITVRQNPATDHYDFKILRGDVIKGAEGRWLESGVPNSWRPEAAETRIAKQFDSGMPPANDCPDAPRLPFEGVTEERANGGIPEHELHDDTR